VVFVTENAADFLDDQRDGPHDHLLDDLEQAGISRDRVLLAVGLQDLIDRFLKPRLEKLQGLEAQVKSGKFEGADLKEAIGLLVQDKTAGDEWDPADLGFDSRLQSPTLTMVEDVYDIEVLDVRGLKGDRVLIEVEASCDCEFDVYIDNWDLCLVDDDDVSITDYNWNEWGAAGSKTASVKASVTLIVNLDSGEIESSEMTEIEGIQPY
jgi:hypothetical protein